MPSSLYAIHQHIIYTIIYSIFYLLIIIILVVLVVVDRSRYGVLGFTKYSSPESGFSNSNRRRRQSHKILINSSSSGLDGV